jgi:hypothetical protein
VNREKNPPFDQWNLCSKVVLLQPDWQDSRQVELSVDPILSHYFGVPSQMVDRDATISSFFRKMNWVVWVA